MPGIKSVRHAFDILNLFNGSNGELGVSEVARLLSMNKSTVSRLMATLESVGILKKNASRKYRLGGKVAELAKVFLSNIDLKTVALPYLKEINEKTGEQVLIHIISGDRRFCLVWIESTYPVRHVIGKDQMHGPLHAGAPSKLLLAYLPNEKVYEIIKRTGLPRYTDKTITSKRELKKELQKIRQMGVAFSNGEQVELVCTVSAPIRNYTGKVVAAFSISWIMSRNSAELKEKYSALAKETANRISQELGYQEEIDSMPQSKVQSKKISVGAR